MKVSHNGNIIEAKYVWVWYVENLYDLSSDSVIELWA